MPDVPSITNNDDPPRNFTVASKDVTAPVDATLQALQAALPALPGATIVRTDRETGVVVIQTTDGHIEKLRERLGDSFLIDPNATLKF